MARYVEVAQSMDPWADFDLCTGMRRFVAEVDAMAASQPPEPSMAEQRRMYDKFARRFTRNRPAGVRIRDMATIDGAADPVPIRIYEPVERDERPAHGLVFFHGGGFALGSIESHDCVVAELALATSTIAISVGYRLAPENPFPAAFDDAVRVWKYVQANADKIGFDPDCTVVGGDSAGAALAVAVCLKARAARMRMPAGQVLIYPALTAKGDLPSYEEQSVAPMLTAESLEYFWSLYTNKGQHADNPYAAPLMAESFIGLPPAFITTANFDPCRDDGALYAQRLKEDGIPVEYRCAAKLSHGHLRARSMSPAAAAEFAALGEGIRSLLRLAPNCYGRSIEQA